MRLIPLLFFVLALWPYALTAQETPCDPEYFKSLKSRAWLEAQREITQNQNLIFKPDSVFEYTCFDLHIRELGDHAKDMFSETGRWGAIEGIHNESPGSPVTSSPESMDLVLNRLVRDPLVTYVNQNFEDDGADGYDLLGGRLEGVDFDYVTLQAGEQVSAVYNCDIMNQVWMAAKCMDFIDNETHDGFFTFEEYRDYDEDHRFLPKQCEHVEEWMQEIDRAYAEDDETPWEEDNIVSFYDLLEPGSCNSSPLILTGLMVNDGGNEFADGVCLKPGCYNNGAGACTGG